MLISLIPTQLEPVYLIRDRSQNSIVYVTIFSLCLLSSFEEMLKSRKGHIPVALWIPFPMLTSQFLSRSRFCMNLSSVAFKVIGYLH